jgi:phage-related protein
MERQTFNWYPDYESEKSVKPNVTVLNFGDDYEQRQAQGLNRIKEEWSLTFTRSYNEINAIDDFLTERSGVESFYWVTTSRSPINRATSGLWTRVNIR